MIGTLVRSGWRFIRRFAPVGMLIGAAIGCVGAGFAAVLVHQAIVELPEPTAMRAAQLEQDAIIVDRHGTRLHTIQFAHAHREVVPLAAMSSHIRDAVIASEDARFFEHHGFDPVGILRAAKQVFLNGRRTGGSTITQQLLKLTLLQGRPSLLRKVEELMLARRYEQLLTKEDLLELYLNAVYFGGGDAGVEAASRSLFGVTAADLTVGEAALLVGMLPAPSAYSPTCAATAARQRQHIVLGRMEATGVLTHPVDTVETSVRLRLSDDGPDVGAFGSAVGMLAHAWPYESGDRMTSTVDGTLQVAAHAALQQALETYTRRLGEHAGPRFVVASSALSAWRDALGALRATLREWGSTQPLVYDLRMVPSDADPASLCQYGGTIFRRAVPGSRVTGIVIAQHADGVELDLGDFHGTLTTKDSAWTKQPPAPIGAIVDVTLPKQFPTDGTPMEVALIPRPVVQGAIVALDPRDRGLRAIVGGYEPRSSDLNRARAARRPIGSTVKPFVYTAAIANGDLGVYDVVSDAPVQYVDPWSGNVWNPKNWYQDPLGPMTAVEALARSVNTAAVATAFTVGIGRVAATIEAMHPVRSVPRAPALALGALEWTPLELANAYAVFASGGRAAGVRTVDRVERGGNVIATPATSSVQVEAPDVMQMLDWMLSRVVRDDFGTAHRLDALRLGIRAKTGTTNGARDAWCIAYTHELVVAVWIGYDKQTSLRRPHGAESSVSLAVPVAAEVFAAAREALGLTPAPAPQLPDIYLTRRKS